MGFGGFHRVNTMSLRLLSCCVLLGAGLLAAPSSSWAQSDTAEKPAAAKPKPKPAAKKPDAKTDAKTEAKPAAKPTEKPAAKPAEKPAEAPKPSPTTGAMLLGTFGDWGAYTAAPNGKKICFALAKPHTTKSDKPVKERGDPYLFVSTRPAEKVKEEVSVIIGYPFKADSEASVEVGQASFTMYTQNDGAWIKNAADEPRMIDTMRKGADLLVKGESGRGTKTTDTYALKGLDQALARVAQECK
jgi:hypothetical protein